MAYVQYNLISVDRGLFQSGSLQWCSEIFAVPPKSEKIRNPRNPKEKNPESTTNRDSTAPLEQEEEEITSDFINFALNEIKSLSLRLR